MTSSLDHLRKHTNIVADTSDISTISKFKPSEATTNPSLILSSAKIDSYRHFLYEAATLSKQKFDSTSEQLEEALDFLTVRFGCELLKVVPGRVSTEVDASLSYDTEASIKKAKKLISLYESLGFSRTRVLIKLAATWEGIQAAQILENEGICCNMTLIFNFVQAVACAEAGVTLISPFVGRIYDWYKEKDGISYYSPLEDPGVRFVTKIYNYFKKFGFLTSVMGASFRNTNQIEGLVGCDFLTISPTLLEKLHASNKDLLPALSSGSSNSTPLEKVEKVTESYFRGCLQRDEMASFKLKEGIHKFIEDTEKLKAIIKEVLLK
ncbi:probable transaldolase isoform X1 [Zophobas morio]|uniref:probable transaldolase isoform X1 n=1 Tax=Zophobas morio TaxID=2755281 RepID=UPI0030839D74